MNYVCILGKMLLFLVLTVEAIHAHQILLKNGKIIKSPSVSENQRVVSYEKYGGMITIPRSDVAKIIYTKSPKKSRKNVSSQSQSTIKGDLVKQLEAAKRPRNPIERANMCSVYIKTVSGAGSGFFISSDGLIVTNRHVVRGSSRQKKLVAEKMDDAEEKLSQYKRELERERKRINKYEAKINRKWQEYEGYKKIARTTNEKQQVDDFRRDLLDHEGELKEWKLNYQKREAEYGQIQNKYSSNKNKYNEVKEEQEGQYKFTVTLADGTKKPAILYKVSDSFDLALLKIKGYTTPYLLPAKKSETALGDLVYAIGSPLHLANSVTSGVLSSYRKDYVQTNAEIYPGNSGGPLVTKDGKVLGVNTLKLVTEKFEGLGFAIHIDLVLQEFRRFLK